MTAGVGDGRPEFADYLCARFAVEHQGPRTIVAAGRGSVGVVWRLETGAARYAVKEFLWGLEESDVRREVAFRDLTDGAGVLSPANIPALDGGYLVRLPPEWGGKLVRVYEWLDGTPVRAGQVPELVGDVLGRMHALGAVPVNDADPWYSVGPDEATWAALAAAGTRAGADWAAELVAALPRLLDLGALTAELPTDVPQILHLDLQPPNLLLVRGRLAVLDWDDTNTGSPERELGFVLAHWHVVDGTVDTTGAQRMVEAYRAAGGKAELHGLSSFGMRIATQLNYVLVQAELALDIDADAATRSTARQRIRDALARLPRRAELHALLDLVARR
ncbi:phosphotransferase [Umezawaea sp. Da 62-37]|uniref:phosphotransferase n=1 Tax=Umezawaea sp. Da 62-37 TaxID=3075927 RepID=UPI0028F710F1|nr:phosphotransferase [Umezawaea sp. Da 62-37]WNV87684.1 phosphotransferase [Umezawaea sp. Da 62-37]